jgi:4-hydroxy-tetrahydrodipicolinate synthase
MREIVTRRRPIGIAAALLPFEADGGIAEAAYAAHLLATDRAGLRNAVNMDTGYVNLLSAEERRRVLRLAREALGPDLPFVAGAYIEGEEGDPATLYRRQIEEIASFGGTPILFQTSRLHGAGASETAAVYREAVRDVPEALAFELGPVFAPNGKIWNKETVVALMEIPALTGMKHSSLEMGLELTRLELRDRIRPDFRVYTGNDLGIRMIEFGSDYLLGLATFCPEAFAARDRAWETRDPGYYMLSESIQFLGAVAFRPPVPAYKHSAAVYLHLNGRIPTDRTHPRSPTRPSWEPEILAACADRIAGSQAR